MSNLPWPAFWSHIPEIDRQPLRDALSELLRHGVILGDDGSGRDLFRLVRDRWKSEVSDYFALLGIHIALIDEPPLVQAQPVPGECTLIAQFTQQETLLALVLWRMYDDALVTTRTKAVLLTANNLWMEWKVVFERIEPPSLSALKESLGRLRRKRLIRFTDADDPTRPGDALIEVLPSLPRAIDFSGLAEWQERVAAFNGESAGSKDEMPANPTSL